MGATGWTARKRRRRQRTRRWSKASRALVVLRASIGRRQRRRVRARGAAGRLRRHGGSVNTRRKRRGDGTRLLAEGRLRRADDRGGKAFARRNTRRTLRSGARCNTRAVVWRRKPSRWCETTRTERGAAVAGRSRRHHDVVTGSGLRAGDPRRKGVLWTNRCVVVVPVSDGRADVPPRETAWARCARARRAAVQGQEGWGRRPARDGSPPV